MQRLTMDSEYEHVNVADYDVVRSTQFGDDYTRGVSILCNRDLSFDMCYIEGNLEI